MLHTDIEINNLLLYNFLYNVTREGFMFNFTVNFMPLYFPRDISNDGTINSQYVFTFMNLVTFIITFCKINVGRYPHWLFQ